MNQSLLSAISTGLNTGGLNYTVFLESVCLSVDATSDPSDYIRRAFGPGAVVEGLRAAAAAEVLEEVTSSLSYAGTEGAGPARARLDSEEFKSLVGQLIEDLRFTIESAEQVWQFRFGDGHPAYSVFWDFAFLFVLSRNVVILIGSGSD